MISGPGSLTAERYIGSVRASRAYPGCQAFGGCGGGVTLSLPCDREASWSMYVGLVLYPGILKALLNFRHF